MHNRIYMYVRPSVPGGEVCRSLIAVVFSYRFYFTVCKKINIEHGTIGTTN